MKFFDHYMGFAACNESPKNFHVWSCLSLLSHIIGRRVWSDEQRFKVYPNMYIILAGPPGVAKSTAKDIARDFFRANFPNVAMAPAAITKEAVVQLMAKPDGPCIQTYYQGPKPIKFSQLSIFADEIISLLTCGGNPTGMIDFMTELFSCSDYRETTKNKGDHDIKLPFLSILACCTIETLKQLVQQKVVSGGMSRRCVFVVGTENDQPHARLFITDEQKKLEEWCAGAAKRIQGFSGAFSWTPEADALYITWYNENFYRGKRVTSSVLQHFLRTKPAYVIKVSMLLALAAEEIQLVHTRETLEMAIRLVTEVEMGAAELFDAQGRNELASIAQDIEQFIKARNKVTEQELKTYAWKELKNGDSKELDKILEHLVRIQRVKINTQVSQQGTYRTYEWTEN